MFIGDPFRDNIWQFISVIISLILGITSLYFTRVIYYKQLRRKVLTYSITDNAPVVTVSQSLTDSIRENIEVRYQGNPILEMYLVIIKVLNSGNDTIKKEDFDNELLEFEFATRTKVLNVKLIDTQPEEIKVSLKPSPDMAKVRIEPVLLKSKEWFKFRVLIDTFNNNNEITTKTRFSDIDVRNANEAPSLPNPRLFKALDIFRTMTLLLCIIVSLDIIYNLSFGKGNNILFYLIIMSMISIIFVMMFIAGKFISNFIEKQEKG